MEEEKIAIWEFLKIMLIKYYALSNTLKIVSGELLQL